MFSFVQNRSLEAESAIDQLETKVGQLERVRQKQAKKLANLKEEFSQKDNEISIKKQSINNTIQALSSELKTTKAALDEVTKRERQVRLARSLLPFALLGKHDSPVDPVLFDKRSREC